MFIVVCSLFTEKKPKLTAINIARLTALKE
jgi:hypothetical protein